MGEKIKVKESQGYDNFVGKTEVDLTEEKSDLSVLFGEDSWGDDEDDSWKNHWKDMPEFVQEKQDSYRTLYVHFDSEEDLQNFSSLISQKISEKTKFIWHPPKQREENILWRWVEEN
jgi:hypothetical protein